LTASHLLSLWYPTQLIWPWRWRLGFQRAPRRFISEDNTLHNHRRENIGPYRVYSHVGSWNGLQRNWHRSCWKLKTRGTYISYCK
jgi:hypothetical protein